MGRNASPAILPFMASAPLPLPIEVQRFEYGHFINSAGLHGHRFNEVMLFESSGDVHRVGNLESLADVGTVDAVGEGQVHTVELSRAAGGWMLLFPDVGPVPRRLSSLQQRSPPWPRNHPGPIRPSSGIRYSRSRDRAAA